MRPPRIIKCGNLMVAASGVLKNRKRYMTISLKSARITSRRDIVEVSINEEKRIVLIWMTNADQHDEVCLKQADSLVKEVCEKGWFSAVFRSGTQDLYDYTAGLLISNVRRSAALHCNNASDAKDSTSA